MEIQTDYAELFELFNEHKVKYLVVGAYALAFHGAPRTTGDIDVLVQPTKGNARRVIDAIKEFGFGSLGLTQKDFTKPDRVIQLGVPPVRIDILTSITGVSWSKAYRGKVKGRYGHIPIYFLSRADYVKNKRSIGRRKDAADLEALGNP